MAALLEVLGVLSVALPPVLTGGTYGSRSLVLLSVVVSSDVTRSVFSQSCQTASRDGEDDANADSPSKYG